MLGRTAQLRAEMASADGAELRELVQSIAAVIETEPGKRLFAHLFYRAGYNRTDHTLDPKSGEIVESAANFNRGRRALYAEIRALVPKSHRKTLLEVELLAEDGWGSGLQKPAAPAAAEIPK